MGWDGMGCDVLGQDGMEWGVIGWDEQRAESRERRADQNRPYNLD